MVKKNDTAPVEPAAEPTIEPKSETPDYAKQLADLQGTISKQGETINELQEFVTGASVVINTIASDENLTKGFKEAIGKQYGVQTQQPQQTSQPQQGYQPSQNTNPDLTRKVDDVVTSERERVIREFEESYGVTNDENGKATRQKIAEYLNGFGWKVADIPLPSLRSSLEKAYIGSVGIEKLREEGKLEGIATMRTNQMGTMGSFASGVPQSGEQTGELTAKQQEWLKKLRVKDVDGAKKLYNDRDQEQEREKPVNN